MSKEDAACVWKCYTHSPTETWLTITPKSIHSTGLQKAPKICMGCGKQHQKSATYALTHIQKCTGLSNCSYISNETKNKVKLLNVSESETKGKRGIRQYYKECTSSQAQIILKSITKFIVSSGMALNRIEDPNFIDMVRCLNRAFVDGHYLVSANTIANTYIPMLIAEVDAFKKMSKANGGTGAFVKYSQDGATNINGDQVLFKTETVNGATFFCGMESLSGISEDGRYSLLSIVKDLIRGSKEYTETVDMERDFQDMKTIFIDDGGGLKTKQQLANYQLTPSQNLIDAPLGIY